jgi:hypothetical protein
MRVLAALTIALLVCIANAAAATMQASSDCVVITGKIELGDDVQLAGLLKSHPGVQAIVLYDSPGGNGTMMQRITQIIRSNNLATGVAGYCISACAMIFLSGVQRYFTDLVPLQRTFLGFHGSYGPAGALASPERLRMISGMIQTETGGKADSALVFRWTHLPQDSTMRFMYPGADGAPKDPTVFQCEQGRCAPVAGYDAFKMGIITSTQILHVQQ